MKKFTLIMIVILFSINAIAIPETLNLQGKLTNSAGTILTGAHTLSARIYDNITGEVNDLLWEENHSLSLDSTGVYDVVLGQISDLGDLSFNDQYFMALKVDSDSEMIPRINMTAVPYAFIAKTAENISSLNLTIGDSFKINYIYPTGLDSINIYNATILNDLRVLGNSYFESVGIGTKSPSSLLDIYGGNLTITNQTAEEFPYINFGPGGYIYDNGTAMVIGHN